MEKKEEKKKEEKKKEEEETHSSDKIVKIHVINATVKSLSLAKTATVEEAFKQLNKKVVIANADWHLYENNDKNDTDIKEITDQSETLGTIADKFKDHHIRFVFRNKNPVPETTSAPTPTTTAPAATPTVATPAEKTVDLSTLTSFADKVCAS